MDFAVTADADALSATATPRRMEASSVDECPKLLRSHEMSVVVHGTAEEISHPDELGMLRRLALQPWTPGTRDHYVQIFPRASTGRRITADAGTVS